MAKKTGHARTSSATASRGYDEVDDRITIPLVTPTVSSSSSSATLRDGIDKYRSLSGRSGASSSSSSIAAAPPTTTTATPPPTAADKSVHATWKSGLVAAVRSSSSSSVSSSFSVSAGPKEPPHVRAQTLMQQKQFAAALPVFTEALAAPGCSAQAKLRLFFQRGTCALAAHRYRQAVEDLTQVIELTPSNALLLAKRAKAFAGLKEHAAALKDYSAAIVMTAPTQEELRGLLLARASVYTAMNNVGAALEDLAQAEHSTRGGERDAELFYQRAQLRQRCRQPVLALQDLDKFMELQEDWESGRGELEEEGEEEEARERHKAEEDEEAEDRRRRLVDVRLERAALLRALASEEEATRLKDAELLATEQGEQQPLLGDGARDYHTTVDTRGKRRQRQASPPPPSPTLSSSVKQPRRKNRTTAMYEASYRSREALALVERAIEDYTQVLLQDPGHGDVLRKRAECWAVVDRADNAFVDFDAALALDQNDFEVHMAKVKLLIAQRETRRAVEELTRVIEINGFFVDALFLRAEIFEAMEEWTQARADYTAIVDGQLESKGGGSSEGDATSKCSVRKAGGGAGGAGGASGGGATGSSISSSSTATPSLLVLQKPMSEYALQALLLRARVSQELHEYAAAAGDYERILDSVPNHVEAQYEKQENAEKEVAYQKKVEEAAVAWLEKEMGRGDTPSAIATGGGSGSIGGGGGASASKAKKKKKKPKKKAVGSSATTPTASGDAEPAEKKDTLRIEDILTSEAVPSRANGESSAWVPTAEVAAGEEEQEQEQEQEVDDASKAVKPLAKKSSFSSVSIVVTRDEACESMWDEQPDDDAMVLPRSQRLRLPSSRGTSPLAASEFFGLRIDEREEQEEESRGDVKEGSPAKATERIAHHAPSTTTTTATDDEDDEPDVEEPTPLEIVTTAEHAEQGGGEKTEKTEEDESSATPSTPSHVTIRERLVDEKYLKKRQKQLEKLRAQLTEACEARSRGVIEETIARAERKQMLDSLEEEVAVAKRVIEEIEEEAKRVEEEQRKQERYRQQEQERAKRLKDEQQANKEMLSSGDAQPREATSPSPTSSLVIRPIAYGHALHIAEQHQQQVLQFQRLLHEKDAEIAYLKSLVAAGPERSPPSSSLVSSSSLVENGVDSDLAKSTIAKLLRGELETATITSRVESLLEWMSPSVEADEARVRILRFLRHVLERHWPTTGMGGVMPLVFVATGSFPMKTYLPTADLDVMLFLPKELEPSWHLTVLHALCMASDASDDGGVASVANGSPDAKSSAAMGPSGGGVSAAAMGGVASSHTVRNVSFINAEVRLVKTTVDNVSVDLTANRVGALGALLLLDEMDRRVGQQHLLKKSLILIKSWCSFESSSGVLGASSGALSTYAINTIVMALFNQHGARITHPLTALLLFLDKMAEFAWHENALTLFGDVPLALLATSGSLSAARLKLQQQRAKQQLHYHNSNANSSSYAKPLDAATLMAMEDVERIRLHVHDQFGALDPSFTPSPAANSNGPPQTTASSMASSGGFKPSSSFQIRACNVVDPVDDSNNLARSVSLDGFPSMKRAFAVGRDRLVALLASSPSVEPSSVDAFFASCWKEYGRGDGWRPDLLVHPRQTWHARPSSSSSSSVGKEQESDKWLSLVPEFLLAPPAAVYVNGHHAYGLPHHPSPYQQQHVVGHAGHHYARHHHQYAQQQQPPLAAGVVSSANGGAYASPSPHHSHTTHSPGQYNGGFHRVGGPAGTRTSPSSSSSAVKTSPRRAQSLPGTSSAASVVAAAANGVASGELPANGAIDRGGRGAERGAAGGRATRRTHESPSSAVRQSSSSR